MYKILIISISYITLQMTAFAQTTDEKIDFLTEQIEQMQNKFNSSNSKTSFGGYGEMVYQNKNSENESGNPSGADPNPTADALRFILYIGHDFSEKWKLVSEIEVEHAKEIYLEQATINYEHSENFNFKVGTLLLPIGITNLKHEPTTFLAVNRPELDSKIIPTTWREIGFSFYGKKNNLSYEIGAVNSLLAKNFSSDGVRAGRQKASKVNAKNLAAFTRLDYALMLNSTLGLSYYTGGASGVDADVTHSLWDIHFETKIKGLEVRALYIDSTIKGADDLNSELGKAATSSIAEKMNGYYVELGYNIISSETDWQLIPFIRYENYDTQATVGSNYTKDKSKNKTNITYGLSAKPLENIVFKVDYIKSSNDASTGVDSFNLGMGWNF